MTCSICIQQKKTNTMTSKQLNHYPHTQAVNYLELLPLYGKAVMIEPVFWSLKSAGPSQYTGGPFLKY